MEPQAAQLPGMPRRLFACTPSRLAAFDCPRRYRFGYLDRPPPPRGRAWAHSSVGAAVHLALARWFGLPAAARTTAAGAELVGAGWQPDGFRDAEQSARWRTIATGWVSAYLDRWATSGSVDDDPVGVERTVAVATPTLALTGRVDRIDDRAGELVVVDYKTGRRSLGVDDARSSQALALYVLAVRRTLRRPCHRVELHHLPTGTIVGYDHTDDSLARQLARAESTAEDVVAATDTLAAGAGVDDVFPPRPGPGCSWCDFRAHCPEGRMASAELQPWAGLDEGD